MCVGSSFYVFTEELSVEGHSKHSSDGLCIYRWYHSALTGREAETLLLAKGQDGSYLVRSSVHNPGSFVLSARVDERVSHVMIRNKDGNFDVGGGPTFPSLTELVEHYKKNPMVETSGTVINLKVPFHATSFLPANIAGRVVELQKQHQDVYGKAGFWEEFEVRVLAYHHDLFFISDIFLFFVCSNSNSKNANTFIVERKEPDLKINQRTDIKTFCHVRETIQCYCC